MWGIYWRYLITLLLIFLGLLYLSNQFDFLNNENYLYLKPTFVWVNIAIIYTFVTLFKKNGFAYLIVGSRLCLGDDIWKKFNVMLISFFIALSIINYLVYLTLEVEIWKLYKLYGQTILLILFPLFGAWLAVQPQKK